MLLFPQSRLSSLLDRWGFGWSLASRLLPLQLMPWPKLCFPECKYDCLPSNLKMVQWVCRRTTWRAFKTQITRASVSIGLGPGPGICMFMSSRRFSCRWSIDPTLRKVYRIKSKVLTWHLRILQLLVFSVSSPNSPALAKRPVSSQVDTFPPPPPTLSRGMVRIRLLEPDCTVT